MIQDSDEVRRRLIEANEKYEDFMPVAENDTAGVCIGPAGAYWSR